MNKPHLTLIIDEPMWSEALPEAEAVSATVFETVVSFLADEIATPLPLSANLKLADDSAVQKLNKEFRNLDRPTNILSFANIDDEEFEPLPDADSFELGDMIIALETMQREAAEKKISLHDHFCHLLTHGLLHLLGYDHQTDPEADEMEALEVQILQKLNIKNPYEE